MDEILLSVSHVTEYAYSGRVELAYHVAHLMPRSSPHQDPVQYQLDIDPPPNDLRSRADTFGNVRSYFSIYTAHENLRVEARGQVRMRDPGPPPDPSTSPTWETVRTALRYQASQPYLPAAEFGFPSPFVPRDKALAQYALASFTPERPMLESAIDLMHRIHADFRYSPASTEVSTPVLQAFRARTGVCQDFSHVMLGCLRSIGLPARYVSGYLLTEAASDRPRPVGADASHAWVSVFCPVNGWVDLDSTNDVIPRRTHVTVAVGRDYGDVAPLRGVIRGGSEHTLAVAVRVTQCAAAAG